ncbi:hypothetical protein F4678DRAFT_25231 [Xylaria arbuscula]|nr:hypothetical protein F4678DRAFT_25231 [Xylaria arbuscula]
MTNPVELQNFFQYEQLPDPKTYIRLLRIRAAPRAEPTEDGVPMNSSAIQCELTSWPLDGAPHYRAVSYTWGDPKKTRWIQVNGKSMEVRWNCAYILWQAYKHSGTDHYIWIDAVCINQLNDREKNNQVSRMGKIFEQADLVLACIGSHDMYSEYLFRVLFRHSRVFTRADTRPRNIVERAINLGFESRLLASWYGNRLTKPLARVLSRPYFQRVWTLPELWLACSIDIVCGGEYIPSQTFHGLYTILYTIEESNSDRSFQHLYYRQSLWTRSIELLRRILFLQGEYSKEKSLSYSFATRHMKAIATKLGEKEDLHGALFRTLDLGCEDFRDRVYAVISIVDWTASAMAPIQPDYNTDVFDLALNVMPLTIWNSNPEKVVRNIIDTLQLTGMTSPKTTEAIQDRRRSNRVSSGTWLETEGVLPIGRPAIKFNGLQIHLDNERWKIEVPRGMPKDTESSDSESAAPELELEVLNALTQPYHIVHQDKFYMVLPPYVQSGDWIVRGDFFNYGPAYLKGALILRERGDGRYKIIGEAHVSEFPWIGGLKAFTVYFERGDLLVFCLNLFSRLLTNQDKVELINRRLDNAVCYTEGSSYAEFG